MARRPGFPTSITLSGLAGPGDGGVATGITEGLPGSPEVRAEVESLINSALHFVLPGDVYGALELCRSAEDNFATATRKLQAMHDVGRAGPKDYGTYETLRQNVYAVENQLAVRVHARVLQLVGAAAAATIPFPALAPAITASSPRNIGGWSGGSRGLGAAPLVAIGWAAAVIAALIALALVAYFVTDALTADNQRDVALLAEQARALNEMYGARRTYVDECVSGGNSRDACAAEAAELYPAPNFMLPLAGSGYGWVPWAVGALGVTVLGVLAYRVYSRERGGFRGGSRGFAGTVLPVKATKISGFAKRRSLSARSRSRYNLGVR